MATKFITPSWRMPRNSNQSKASNYSVDFNNDGYIDINPGASSGVDLTSFTISAWVKWDTESNSYGTAIRLSTSGDDIWMYVGRSTGFNFGVRFYLGSTLLDDPDFLPTNEWKHVVIRYDESATSMKIYVDGQEKVSSTVNKNPSLWNTTSNNQIGANGSSSEKMRGRLSQISVFDYALSTGSISALYNSGIPVNPLAVTTPPTAYYDLGQGSAYASGSAGIVEPNLAQATGSTVFEFDGSDLIVASTDMSSELNQISGSISVSCWAKTTQTTVYKYLLVRSRLGGPTKDQGWSFTKDNFYGSGGRMIFGLTNTNGDTMQVRLTGTNDPQGNPLITMNDGEWHHLSATYNRSTSTINLYTDGVLQGTTTTSGFGDYPIPTFGNMEAGSGGSRTCIGGYNNGSTMSSLVGSWIGEVSNTQIWDESLTTAEIVTLYNNGTPLQSNIPQSGSLKAWYKLGLDTSAFNSDDTLWTVENNFTTPTYTEGLFFGGSYIGGSPSANYAGMRLANQTISSDHVTYSFWYKKVIPGTGSSTGIVLAGGYLGQINVTSTGVVQWIGDGAAKYINFSPGNVKDGAWHHVLVYYPNGSTVTHSDVKCYIDGALQTNSYIGGSSSSGPVTMIQGTLLQSIPVNVVLSNWSYFLSDQTGNIDTIYNGGTPGDISSLNPDVWLKYNSATTSLTGATGAHYGIATDSSGNNNSGSLAGKTDGSTTKIISNTNVITGGESSGMDSTNLVPSNLIKSIPYSGYSMDFDVADDDSINCGTDTSLNILSNLSISVWFKTSTTGTNKVIINRDPGSGTRIWQLGVNSSNQIYVQFRGSSTGQATSTTTYTDGNWHNAIAIYDPSTSVKLYIDGDLVNTDSTSIPSSLTDDSSVPLYIGAYSSFGSENFDGHLSNASIFNRILTEDEILRVYNGGSPGDLSNLNPTSWWSLGVDSYFNGSNWICPDIGTNTNDGTSANMAAVNLVGDGPDSLANGTSTNLNLGSDLVGNAPGSTGNSLSVNMNFTARTGSTP